MQRNVDVDRVLEENRQFHDEVEAHVYDQRMGVRHDPEAVRRTVAELEGVLGEPLPAGTHVFDLGAGTGNIAVKLAIDGRFSDVTAVDISVGMLQQAEASAKANGVTINTVVSDMCPLPFDDNHIDFVVGCAMLHHMPKPDEFLDEVHRVLAPGASAIFIGEPSIWGERITNLVKLPMFFLLWIYRLFTGKRPKVWEHDMIDVHTFSIDEIRTMTAKFDRVRFRPEGFLEPIVDQGLLVPFQRALGKIPGVPTLCRALRWLFRFADRCCFNHILPGSLLVSIKFACWK